MQAPTSSAPAATPLRPMAEFRGYPLVGIVPQIARVGMLEFLTDAWVKNGDMFRMKMGPKTMVGMAHPDAIEHVLVKNRANYVKGETYDSIRPLTGAGLLTLEGEAWKKRRRLAQPAFHREKLGELVEAMVAVTAETLDGWKTQFAGGVAFDAHVEMMRLTLDIVGATLLGQRFSRDTMNGSAQAFGTALELLSSRGNSPFPFLRWLPTPSNVRLRRALAFADEMVHEIIHKARASDGKGPPTLLKMLLDARDADTDEGLSDQELRDEVVTLVLAGHETTALLLSWAFTLLGRAPDVVQRMRDEVFEVLGHRAPTPDDLPKLTYLGSVIDEVLRLRPPVYTVARDVVADDVVMGHPVRAGETILPLLFLAHQHPAFWTDPSRFDPERFRKDRKEARHHGAYAPFSLGARVCIGNVFTLIESKIILAMLLQRGDFELASDAAVRQKAVMTVRPATPILIRMKFRN
jgi:cytochrome P450